MKKIVFLFICMMAGTSSAVFAADPGDRDATLIDKTGTAWEIAKVFMYTEPNGFYESRFCLTVAAGPFLVAIPPENLLSVEMKGADCTAVYQWMGKRQRIFGRVVSKLVGGKGRFMYMTREFKDVKSLTFKDAPMVMKGERLSTYDETLVLKDGTRVPVAKLLKVSSQDYPEAPSAGFREGTLFELHNDIGFLQGKNAPTITYENIESIAFPTPNSIMLTFMQSVGQMEEKTAVGMDNNGENDTGNKKGGEEGFLLKAIEDLGEGKRNTKRQFPKNWAYGFSGIFSKGYFFIDGGQVKAIAFGAVPE